MTDERIISLLTKRDEQGLALLQEQYRSYCSTIIYGLLRDAADTEEVLNTLWLQIWNAIPPASPSPLKPYLAKAARNAALHRVAHDNAQKRSGVELPLDELEEVLPAAAQEWEAGELSRSINRFLSRQKPEARRMFIQRYWFCKSLAELSALFGKKERTIASCLFRVRKQLREYLEKEGYAP